MAGFSWRSGLRSRWRTGRSRTGDVGCPKKNVAGTEREREAVGSKMKAMGDAKARDFRALTVQLVFFLQSFAFASWLTRLPAIKSDFALSEGEIGALLVTLPLGAVVASPIAGAASVWVSLRVLTVVSLSIMAFAIGLIGFAPSALVLAPVLVLVGLGAGAVGVAMNAAAIATEASVGRPILMRCHAMFSIGLAAGALAASGFVAAGVSTAPHLLTVSVLVVSGIALLSRWLPGRAIHDEPEGPKFAWPAGAVIIPSLIACGSMVAEGATMDWAAIFLRTVLDAPASSIGFGVAAFSGAMALVRFFGDSVLSNHDDSTLLAVGAGLGATGYGIVTIAPDYRVALAGYAVVGFGLAPIMPTAFRVAGRLSASAPALGVAAASSAATVGFLLGPALIGFLAEIGGLRLSFAFVVGLLCCVGLLSRKL